MILIIICFLIIIGLQYLDPMIDIEYKIIWYNWKGERKWFKYE